MESVHQLFDAMLGVLFAAFSRAPAAVPLTVLAALAGAGMLWVFAKTSDQRGIKAAKRRVYASLLELRLFADEPAVVWRAQRSLFAANFRYLTLSLVPALWMALPVGMLMLHLESFYGRAPLPLAREAVVTMGMAPSWDLQASAPQLAAPAGIVVEGPAVRVMDAREVSWRIRPARAGSAALRFSVGGREIVYTVEAGGGLRSVPGRSVRSVWSALWHPARRVRDAQVEWIEVRYPEPALTVFGISVNWLVWFFVVSLLAALLLRPWRRVVI